MTIAARRRMGCRGFVVLALFIGGIAASVVGDVVVIVGSAQWIVGGRRVERLRASR